MRLSPGNLDLEVKDKSWNWPLLKDSPGDSRTIRSCINGETEAQGRGNYFFRVTPFWGLRSRKDAVLTLIVNTVILCYFPWTVFLITLPIPLGIMQILQSRPPGCPRGTSKLWDSNSPTLDSECPRLEGQIRRGANTVRTDISGSVPDSATSKLLDLLRFSPLVWKLEMIEFTIQVCSEASMRLYL